MAKKFYLQVQHNQNKVMHHTRNINTHFQCSFQKWEKKNKCYKRR